MTHVRRQIREAVVATLTGLDGTEDRVYQSRTVETGVEDLPCLIVYTLSETSEIDAMGVSGDRETARSLTVQIEIYDRSDEGVDDNLDDIAVRVETAVTTDSALDDLCRDRWLVSTAVDLTGEGERSSAKMVQLWTMEYRTVDSDPETAR